MPTANRKSFVALSIKYFLRQKYPNLELVILDDGHEDITSVIPAEESRIKYHKFEPIENLGMIRNLACSLAAGEIIIHWDDDDWYSDEWVSMQYDVLQKTAADICGLRKLHFFSTDLNEHITYRDDQPDSRWLYGATLAYRKAFWAENKFKSMQTGEDYEFVVNSNAVIVAHEYVNGYLGIIHKQNLGIIPNENPIEKRRIEKWYLPMTSPILKKKEEISFLEDHSTLVSCIMPTANRQKFIPLAIHNFVKQNYANKELIIVDDGTESIKELVPDHPNIRYFYTNEKELIGNKRNTACEKARGEIIIHWDDDDWYSEDWISSQIKSLKLSGADICGINQVQFFSPLQNTFWMIKNLNTKKPWLTGASLCYWKSFWKKHPFKNLQTEEDNDFVRYSGAKIYAHDYFQGFIAILHANNTTIKDFENPKHKKASQ